jgi:hypothetical protein
MTEQNLVKLDKRLTELINGSGDNKSQHKKQGSLGNADYLKQNGHNLRASSDYH